MGEQDKPTRGRRKTMSGVVKSRSGDKTVVVETEVRKAHPIYGKTTRQRTRFHAHDERNEAGVGDMVTIMESRPMSRMKRWRVVRVTQKAVLLDTGVKA
ncbi:MAG: 30S ribosomal protein S17 [Kiritimatiellia bacterium]